MNGMFYDKSVSLPDRMENKWLPPSQRRRPFAKMIEPCDMEMLRVFDFV